MSPVWRKDSGQLSDCIVEEKNGIFKFSIRALQQSSPLNNGITTIASPCNLSQGGF
jgi:hypothetical protein